MNNWKHSSGFLTSAALREGPPPDIDINKDVEFFYPDVLLREQEPSGKAYPVNTDLDFATGRGKIYPRAWSIVQGFGRYFAGDKWPYWDQPPFEAPRHERPVEKEQSPVHFSTRKSMLRRLPSTRLHRIGE